MVSDKINFLSSISEDSLLALLDKWHGMYPDFGICAFLPESEKTKLPLLQNVLSKRNIPLVGGIFPALVCENEFKTEGILLFCFEKMPAYQLFENEDLDGKSIAQKLKTHLGNYKSETLFLLFDAMVPNIGTLLDELYLELADQVNYFGANAGSESFQSMPCLFNNGNLIENGLLAMILPHHKGAVLEHGYHIPKQTFYATSTSGNRISQIDWKPAFPFYQDLVQKQFGITIDQTNFYELAVHYPFGIIRAADKALVRIPVALQEDGSLFCVGEVPENSILALLECPEVDSSETVKTIQKGVTTVYGSTENLDILLFYCAGRRLHLGIETATQELHELQKITSTSKIFGALSLGEIGNSSVVGYPLFHNATIVASKSF